MNYIRGAVNAISAPYQYYKDLPPINPSTLTGAIDVIVIQRPTDNGDTELVCSPFHVRFGKWQILRPGEKKVNVFVNGNPIPFNMKVGEAGEAFFVFETDDDVSPDLITSPILQPTVPEENIDKKPIESLEDAVSSGAKQDNGNDNSASTDSTQSTGEPTRVEPDFLDLDGKVHEEDVTEDVRTTPKQTFTVPHSLRKSGSKATINQSSALSQSSSSLNVPQDIQRSHTPEMDEQDERVDQALKAIQTESHVPEVEYHDDVTLDMEGYKSGYHDRIASDQTVRSSDSPSTSSKLNPKELFRFPRQTDSSTLPTKPSRPFPQTQSAIHSPYESSPSPSPSPSPPSSPPSSLPIGTHIHPYLRATSEPPPDVESDGDALGDALSHSGQGHTATELAVPVQEYSWEWGAFPQPSPMKATFGKGGRIEPPHKALWGTQGNRKNKTGFAERKGMPVGMVLPSPYDGNGSQEGEIVEPVYERANTTQSGRSRSVPPHIMGSPARKGRRGSREYKEYEDINEQGQDEDEERGRGGRSNRSTGHTTQDEDNDHKQDIGILGAGGALSTSRDDPTMFVLSIDDSKIGFQLSLVPVEDDKHNTSLSQKTSRQDEFEITENFDRFRVDWNRFLDNESIVHDPRLVIRWAGNHQYITRKDGSPLMDSLVHWRSSVLEKRASGDAVRPVSPPPSRTESHHNIEEPTFEFPTEQKVHGRSKSEPPSAEDIRRVEEEDGKTKLTPDQGQTAAPKPTSSSWVNWWSRSRRKEGTQTKGYSVLDSDKDSSSASLPLSAANKKLMQENPKTFPETTVKTAGSAPMTPIQHPVDSPVRSASSTLASNENTPTKPGVSVEPTTRPMKRFAKTLRLTSDQLKSLNLRPGANAITFSLSASGAIAATARIFVWDSTDLVVISDIDGTITKSDGLGHVFAMIGRDWTHLGVAKLYTDITRNGYKIMYLTSRAIGQADATRDYLKGIKQNNYQLPEGPVIMSPDRLMASLHREVIMRKPEVFKMACLRDIQRLFGESARNPFYAGFGNRITDALSYRSVNVPSARIFTIDTTGEVKMELLELAGYKSSYIHMTDLVDQMFPPIHRKWMPEFTDFNYWKPPVQDFPLPDLSPPSPALSARSDTSNRSTLARLRNFSLGGNATRPSTNDIHNSTDGDSYRSSHLRQMSSFEKLSSTLGFSSSKPNGDYRRSASPETASSYAGSDEEDEDDFVGPDGQRRRRPRRRSITSMPGTLDESHFGMDDDEEDEDEDEDAQDDDEGDYDGEGETPEEKAEEAFDDDLLAAGEMQNVPFL